MADALEVKVSQRTLRLTNLDKILYPEAAFTKSDVIHYYAQVSSVMVPHLQKHPITFKRFPNGVTGEAFFEKHCTKYRPDWIQTAAVWNESHHQYTDYCLIHDAASLVWAANLAALELHVSLSQATDLNVPKVLAFDLDPGLPATIVQCAQVALIIRKALAKLELECFAKTSGKKGMQVYVPLKTKVTYEETKTFARALAMTLEQQHPEIIVSNMSKALRGAKVFIDWSQNDAHKTTIGVYSLRAESKPTVSTPLRWQEVEQCYKKKDATRLVFLATDVLRRVEKHGDLFAGVAKLKQKLPKLKGGKFS